MASLVTAHHVNTLDVLRAGLSLIDGETGVFLIRGCTGGECVGYVSVLCAAALTEPTVDTLGPMLTEWVGRGISGVVLHSHGIRFTIQTF